MKERIGFCVKVHGEIEAVCQEDGCDWSPDDPDYNAETPEEIIEACVHHMMLTGHLVDRIQKNITTYSATEKQRRVYLEKRGLDLDELEEEQEALTEEESRGA